MHRCPSWRVKQRHHAPQRERRTGSRARDPLLDRNRKLTIVKRGIRYGLWTLGGVVLIGIGAGIGGAGSHTTTLTKVSTVTVTKTQDVPVPGETKTVTAKVPVPGPTVTATATVTAPPPPQGAVTNTFPGSGNQVTPSFNVPADGNYIVTWTFSGNTDPTLGNPSNFIIQETGGGDALGLPNVVQSSGSGSTEVTGAGSTDRLNVQAAGQWTITIRSA